MWNQCGMSSIWISWRLTFAWSCLCQEVMGRGGKVERAGSFSWLVIASTTRLSSHSAVAYLENFKQSGEKKKKKKKKNLLNQFHSPVNYNPAFLISSLHTMLFIGIQAKHGPLQPAQLCRTNCPLMQSLPVRSTGAWLKKCIPWCSTERCVRWKKKWKREQID